MAIVSRFTNSNQNPIGMIVPAMLTETQFQALNGPSWVAIDGRSVAGSKYAEITGLATLPDARGMALRGQNTFGSSLGTRADGNQNPDGTALGGFQNHGMASHTHNLTLFGNVPAVTNLPASSGSGAGGTAVTGAPNSGSANETRMRNITVNYFIKINP